MFGDLVPPIHYTGLSVIEPQSCAPADADNYCRPTALETAREFHLAKSVARNKTGGIQRCLMLDRCLVSSNREQKNDTIMMKATEDRPI
jgi:hypothetical protein